MHGSVTTNKDRARRPNRLQHIIQIRLRRIAAMQRHSTSSNLTRRSGSTSSLTRIPTAGDLCRCWGFTVCPRYWNGGGGCASPGAAVLGNLAGRPRCRQAPATTTTVVPRAAPAAAGAKVVDDGPAAVRLEVRLEVHLIHLVHLEVHSEVRLEVRPEVHPEVRLTHPEARPEVRLAAPGPLSAGGPLGPPARRRRTASPFDARRRPSRLRAYRRSTRPVGAGDWRQLRRPARASVWGRLARSARAGARCRFRGSAGCGNGRVARAGIRRRRGGTTATLGRRPARRRSVVR